MALSREADLYAFDVPDEEAERISEELEAEDRLISTNSFSKAWEMTGWRLGWIVAPAALHEDLGKLIEYITSCAPDFVQAAGRAALDEGEPAVAALRRDLQAKRDRLLAALGPLPEVEASRPGGGMYVLLRVGGFAESVPLAKRLVEEAGLGLAPGLAFGEEAEGWLRWCFAADDAALAEGVRRLGAWLAGKRRPG